MDSRARLKEQADASYAKGDQTGWFEPLYASVNGDISQIPWADQHANPHLVSWLDQSLSPAVGRSALVVASGLGEDAEELAAREYDVTGFDIAPSAIAWTHRRFPQSQVKYVTEDLLNPPGSWTNAFDLVFEAYTLQVLRGDARETGVRNIAGFTKPGGELLVICRGRLHDEPEGDLPFPLTREDLRPLETRWGMRLVKFEEFLDGRDGDIRRFRAHYRKPAVT